MVSKVFVFCTFAFFIQAISGEVCRPCGLTLSNVCPSIAIGDNGCALLVSSVGPIAPSGIAVATELGLNGNLEVAGEVPYLSAVSFEGQFDTSGLAPVSYGCGDGCIAITQEIGNPSGVNAAVGTGTTTINTCGCNRRY